MEMRLELVSVPVSDVDRAKDFYTQKLGFHEDMDATIPDGRRFVQLTPSGSACSITIGEGITKMKSGSMDALLLVVQDIEAAYKILKDKGIEITKPEMMPWGVLHAELHDPDGNHWTLQQPREQK
jgi:catechol 2,3-dioxygenase-like lactoylglutathione lyase family enzyme